MTSSRNCKAKASPPDRPRALTQTTAKGAGRVSWPNRCSPLHRHAGPPNTRSHRRWSGDQPHRDAGHAGAIRRKSSASLSGSGSTARAFPCDPTAPESRKTKLSPVCAQSTTEWGLRVGEKSGRGQAGDIAADIPSVSRRYPNRVVAPKPTENAGFGQLPEHRSLFPIHCRRMIAETGGSFPISPADTITVTVS